MQAYRKVLREWDIVCCADESKAGPASKAFYELYNHFLGTQYLLESDNFWILSRRGIKRICSMSQTVPYRKAVYANCGLRFQVIPFKLTIHSEYRKDRKTKNFEKYLRWIPFFCIQILEIVFPCGWQGLRHV